MYMYIYIYIYIHTHLYTHIIHKASSVESSLTILAAADIPIAHRLAALDYNHEHWVIAYIIML